MDVAVLLSVLPLGMLLWILIGIILMAFGVFSGILYYHWHEYSTGRYTTAATMVVYLAGSAFFFALMAIGATWASVAL